MQLAFKTGFFKRSPKKIDAHELLALMCLESQKGSPSYNDLASRHQSVYKKNASKQAVSKKFNPSCVLFFQSVLAFIIQSKLSLSESEVFEKLGKYTRALVQDSTIIKLPITLFEVFAGVSNAHISVCNARIQGVYDLVSGSFISFSIDTYRQNDISVAPELEIRKGDLTIRDRGYYSNAELKRHVDAEADCIYRYKSKNTFFNPESKKAINILELLKKEGSIDMEVLLNDENRTKVRLIGVPVSDEVSNLRRMKAKKENKVHNPSKELLDLMSWTIFVTTISKGKADFVKVLALYGLRWRIETIFKSWKSNMEFAKVHRVSENQLRVLLTARFIMIVICMDIIFKPWSQRIRKKYNRELSMLKLFKYLKINPEKITEILSIISKPNKTIIKNIDEVLIRYCTYDKRKLLNFNQIALLTLS